MIRLKILPGLMIIINLCIINGCLLSTKADIQINEGKIKYRENSKIYLSLQLNPSIQLISRPLLWEQLNKSITAYRRYPAFQLTKHKEQADCQVEIRLNRLDFNCSDRNLPREAQKEEKNQTVKRINTCLDFAYHLQIEIFDQIGQYDRFDSIEHSQKIVEKKIKKNPLPPPFSFSTLPLNGVFHMITREILEDITRAMDSGKVEQAYPKKIRQAARQLISQLYEDICFASLAYLDDSLYKYLPGRVRLLAINKEIDQALLKDFRHSQKMIDYLIQISGHLPHDQKTHCFYNIAALYLYQMDQEQAKFYSDQAGAMNQSLKTKRQYHRLRQHIYSTHYRRSVNHDKPIFFIN